MVNPCDSDHGRLFSFRQTGAMPFVGEFLRGLVVLPEMGKAHAAQYLRRLGKLDIVVADDLDASLENGLLHVDLVREIPEMMKPRVIPILSTRKVLEVKPTKVAA